MSTDKLNCIIAIASRQPAINPARHHVSPAVLEYRLQQVEKERDEALRELGNIVRARRFDRQMFRDDTEFADWAISRATHMLAKIGGA